MSITPASGTTLLAQAATTFAASSATKTLSQFLLFQVVAGAGDAPLQFATQAPFSIPFTPRRLGTIECTAIAIFTDNTYAVVPLTFTAAATTPASPFPPFALNLIDTLTAPLDLGETAIVRSEAVLYEGQAVDVTAAATYHARGGSSAVFNVAPGGIVTAIGNGMDWLDVSYGALTASTMVTVGSCSYTVSSMRAAVPAAGGNTTIQLTTNPGCSWRTESQDGWLAVSPSAGTGSAVLTVSGTANAGGARAG